MRRTAPGAIRAAITLVLALCLVSPTLAEQIVGRVVSVADGDTITLLTAGNQQVKVRLNGIDAPESAQPFGQAAKQFTAKKVAGKTVTVDVKDTDRYGRAVGNVLDPESPGKLINHALVRNGYAWWYRQYAPHDATLRQLEWEARQAKVGLWSEPKTAIAPWEWRRGVRPQPAVASAPARSSSGSGGSYRPARTAPIAATVYITRSGAKYHRDGCRYLSRSRIPIILKDAEAQGYTVCSVCW